MMNDSFFGRLADLIVKPARLMENVGADPRFWQPLLLIFVLTIVASYLTLPISGPEQIEIMQDSKALQMAPAGTWQEMYDNSLDMTPGQLFQQSLGASLFTTLILVLPFSFIIGFFVRMSGGKGTMRQALGLGMWAALIPFGVSMLVRLPLILATESTLSGNIGLAALVPNGDMSMPLYQVLMTYGDVFTWWGLIVLVVGYRDVFHLPTRTAAISVILPWIPLSSVWLGVSLLATM